MPQHRNSFAKGHRIHATHSAEQNNVIKYYCHCCLQFYSRYCSYFLCQMQKNCPEIHATIKTANFGQIHPEAPLDNPFEFCQTGDKFSPNSPFSSNNVTLQGAPLDIASDSPNPRQIFGQIRHFRNSIHFWT